MKMQSVLNKGWEWVGLHVPSLSGYYVLYPKRFFKEEREFCYIDHDAPGGPSYVTSFDWYDQVVLEKNEQLLMDHWNSTLEQDIHAPLKHTCNSVAINGTRFVVYCNNDECEGYFSVKHPGIARFNVSIDLDNVAFPDDVPIQIQSLVWSFLIRYEHQLYRTWSESSFRYLFTFSSDIDAKEIVANAHTIEQVLRDAC